MIRKKLAILFILATIAPRPMVSLPLPVPSDIPPDIPTNLNLRIVNDPELLQSLPSPLAADWDRALASLSGHASGEAHNQPYQPPQAIQPSHFQQHTSDHFAAPVVPQSSQSSYARPTTTANTHTQLQSTSYHPNPNPNFTPNIHVPQGPQRAGADQVVPPNTAHPQSASHYPIPNRNIPPNINVPQRAGVVHWQQNSPSPPLPHLSAFTQPWPPSQPLTLSHHDESGASGSSSRPNINLPQQASVVQQNSPSPYAPQGSQRPQRRAGAVQVVPPNTDFGLGHTQHQSTSHNPNFTPNIHAPQREQNSPSPPSPYKFTFSSPRPPKSASPTPPPGPHSEFTFSHWHPSESPPLQSLTFVHHEDSASRPNRNFEETAKQRADASHGKEDVYRLDGTQKRWSKRNEGGGELECPVPGCRHKPFYRSSHVVRHIRSRKPADHPEPELTDNQREHFASIAREDGKKLKQKADASSTVKGSASGDASGSKPPPHKKQRKS